MATLQNGFFDGNTWRKCFDGGSYNEIDVPEHWYCFWDKNGMGENGQANARPEVKVIGRVPPYLIPSRIPAAAEHAVELFTFMKPHRAGIYTFLTDLKPGTVYKVTAQYHAWCSQGDDPYVSDQKASYGMYGMLGVDLEGRVNQYGYVDPAYDNKSWFTWTDQLYVFDAFQEVSITFTATTARATLALLSCSKWGSKHGDAYWGAVELTTQGETEPEPEPEPEPTIPELLAAVRDIVDQLTILNATLKEKL